MAMLNIPTSVDDPAYRYKMPRLLSKKEGRGIGIKTCIMNMGDVAAALKSDPVYCVKFFGYELGAQSSYTNKMGEGERAIINGHHDTKVFQDLLDKFIDKYVLCKNCDLPETDLVVKKGTIKATCKACGWLGKFSPDEKMASYIVKHPPETGIGFGADTGKRAKVSREQRQQAREERKRLDERREVEDDDDEDEKRKMDHQDKTGKTAKKDVKASSRDDGDDGKMKDTKDKREKKEKRDKNDKKDNKKSKKDKTAKEDPGENDDGGESEEGSDAKYGDESIRSLINDMVIWSEMQGKLTPSALQDELRPLQVTLRFDNDLRMFVVLSILFKNGRMDAKGVTEKAAFLKYFIAKGSVDFDEWIYGVDAFLDSNPVSLKGYPAVLKALFDAGVAEEADLLRHYRSQKSTPGFEAASKAAAPFLTWLETASCEDDSDEGGSGSGSSSDSD